MSRRIYPSLAYMYNGRTPVYQVNKKKQEPVQIVRYPNNYHVSHNEHHHNSTHEYNDYVEIKIIFVCMLILVRNFMLKTSYNLQNNRDRLLSIIGLENILKVIDNFISSSNIKSFLLPTVEKIYFDILTILFGTSDDQKDIFIIMTREVNKLNDEYKKNNLIRFIGSIEMLISMIDNIYCST